MLDELRLGEDRERMMKSRVTLTLLIHVLEQVHEDLIVAILLHVIILTVAVVLPFGIVS